MKGVIGFLQPGFLKLSRELHLGGLEIACVYPSVYLHLPTD